MAPTLENNAKFTLPRTALSKAKSNAAITNKPVNSSVTHKYISFALITIFLFLMYSLVISRPDKFKSRVSTERNIKTIQYVSSSTPLIRSEKIMPA